MRAASQPFEAPHRLLADFAQCRASTEAICARLEIEDHVVQPAPFVSPPKWHLAHATWFFDCFLLEGAVAKTLDPGFRRGDGGEKGRGDGGENGMGDGNAFSLLFNSYYKTLGPHWLQERRGQLSRPTVREVQDYRHAVTEAMLRKLERSEFNSQQLELLELGMHHEQQHQELLLMDIKYILGGHPQMPAYDEVSLPASDPRGTPRWLDFAAGLRQVGHGSGGFAFDNERPRHRVWLDAFSLRDQLVRNGEYLEFMRAGGYCKPEYWLSDGWDWIQRNRITAPLYWRSRNGDEWFEYQLGGLHRLDPGLPVAHVSYYEAAAFARWAGARLPTEAELEVASVEASPRTNRAFWTPGSPVVPMAAKALDSLENGLLWQWCSNAYEAYPGYVRSLDALGEYNGKFMSGRHVLRGGCVATPVGHWRPTYRNFYRPEDRWCFSGIRLARDAT